MENIYSCIVEDVDSVTVLLPLSLNWVNCHSPHSKNYLYTQHMYLTQEVLTLKTTAYMQNSSVKPVALCIYHNQPHYVLLKLCSAQVDVHHLHECILTA